MKSSRKNRIGRLVAGAIATVLLSAILFGTRILRPATARAQQAQPSQMEQALKAADRKILYWYDPMHPSYRSDKPGKAPDCGMDLVPAYAGEGPSKDGMIAIDEQRQKLLGVRTGTVEEETLTRTLRTSGQVVPDETRIAHIHVKTSGWIEKVYGDFVGQLVRKGQPLFTIYSPDLLASEQEYLIAKRGAAKLANAPYQDVANGAQSLLQSSRERLKLWDLTDAQIQHLDQTGEAQRTITYFSPATGYIVDRKAYPNVMADPALDLYTVADLSRVWIEADVYEYELPYVKVGQKATVRLNYAPGREFDGRVAYILPVLDPQTHTAKVRIDVPNPRLELKPNMFADVELSIDYGRHMAVPTDAVLNGGNEQIVFVVHEGGKFEPRKVQVGPQVDDKTIILFGLEKGETIVASGNFLIDSESQMKSVVGQ